MLRHDDGKSGIRVSQLQSPDTFDPDPEFLRPVASSADSLPTTRHEPRGMACQAQQEGRYSIWVHISTAPVPISRPEIRETHSAGIGGTWGRRGLEVQMDGRRCLDNIIIHLTRVSRWQFAGRVNLACTHTPLCCCPGNPPHSHHWKRPPPQQHLSATRVG